MKTCLPASIAAPITSRWATVEVVTVTPSRSDRAEQPGQVRGELDTELVGEGLTSLGIVVPDRDQLGVGMFLRTSRVVPGVDMPGTDDGDTQRSWGFGRLGHEVSTSL